MQIKIKNEMNDVRIKVSHRELVLLAEALYMYSNNTKYNVDYINNQLFDTQEFVNTIELVNEVNNLDFTINKTVNLIGIY